MDGDPRVDGTGFSYTIDWFSGGIPIWQWLFSEMSEVAKVLEIGSYEGRSAVWLIENAFKQGGKGDMYCVDTWQGGVEHDAAAMAAVETRFFHNIALAKSRSRAQVDVHVLKGTSTSHLAKLLAEGNAGSFDAVHVDGSHQCADVLSDLVLSFALLRTGGVMICDDYFWSLEERGREDLLNQPKLAIDSFVNCYRRKLSRRRSTSGRSIS
jgi:predicted O-methyltransferase YrrM